MPEPTHPALAPLVALADDLTAEVEELRAEIPPVGPSRVAHIYRTAGLSDARDRLRAAIAEASALLGEVREEWGHAHADEPATVTEATEERARNVVSGWNATNNTDGKGLLMFRLVTPWGPVSTSIEDRP